LQSKGQKNEERKRKNKYKLSIFADRNRINQVISNLLSNAVKFTNTDTIDIIIEKHDSKNNVFVNIKDTRFGIDSSILPKLFWKFATK
jgi:signal transduction histidine kinase